MYFCSYSEAILFIERNCDHSVVAFNLCAICGMDMKRYHTDPYCYDVSIHIHTLSLSLCHYSNKDAPGHLSMVPAIPQVTVNEQVNI